MALSKVTVIDRIEITEHGHVQVRRATYIEEDGVRIAGPMYHRVAYEPGTAIDSEDTRVKAHAQVAWTPEVVDAHRRRVGPQRPEPAPPAPRGPQGRRSANTRSRRRR